MRRSGVLLHITSLPSPGGIGTLGAEAREFVDWLKEAGMSIWQVLPIGPTGYGDSPYQSPCTHAGNLMMIDLRTLHEEGLLSRHPDDFLPDRAAGGHMTLRRKTEALKTSFRENRERLKSEVDAFVSAHPDIDDYALFMAVKDCFDGRMWIEWPDMSIRFREQKALDYYRRVLSDEIAYYKYIQYLFFRQWHSLKAYAHSKGIRIFGDMPIYVAEDSSDTWAHPDMFQLDRDLRPVKVAGVPPDYFAKDGQLWGNPLYNWKALSKTDYKWWLNRLKTAGELYDIVRIDHFIGFANYYAVKAGAINARSGRWENAPGFSFFRTVKKQLPELEIIAEDLGVVSDRVKRLLRYCGYPGMKVLSFGFDSDETNPHFPANVRENCVLYTGTHDNDTAEGWWQSAGPHTREMAKKYLPERGSISSSLIEAALGSIANTAMIPMQDILGLGSEARMNTPGTVGGTNWQWRMKSDALTHKTALELKDMNEFFDRIPEE
ncbi:MAG: 4-alpha-glucanotransferase [Clostridia bacterium]|nr:4-alpha-glucanotransferase [Clostridia bacterium]